MSSVYGGSYGGGSYGSSYGGTTDQATAAFNSLTPKQQALILKKLARQKLGAPPRQEHHGLFHDIISAPLGIVGKAADQIASSLIHTPAALYRMGRDVTLDAYDVTQGDINFNRTADIAKGIALGTYEDFRHPLRNPGYLAMDLFNIASLGAGAAARVGRVGAELDRLRALHGRGGPEPLLPPGTAVPRPKPLPEGGMGGDAVPRPRTFSTDALNDWLKNQPGQPAVEPHPTNYGDLTKAANTLLQNPTGGDLYPPAFRNISGPKHLANVLDQADKAGLEPVQNFRGRQLKLDVQGDPLSKAERLFFRHDQIVQSGAGVAPVEFVPKTSAAEAPMGQTVAPRDFLTAGRQAITQVMGEKSPVADFPMTREAGELTLPARRASSVAPSPEQLAARAGARAEGAARAVEPLPGLPQGLPQPVLDRASGLIRLQGTKLSFRPVQRGPVVKGGKKLALPGGGAMIQGGQDVIRQRGFQMFNGSKPFGPIVATAEDAVKHLQQHFYETKVLKSPSHLTHPDLYEEAAKAAEAKLGRKVKPVEPPFETSVPVKHVPKTPEPVVEGALTTPRQIRPISDFPPEMQDTIRKARQAEAARIRGQAEPRTGQRPIEEFPPEKQAAIQAARDREAARAERRAAEGPSKEVTKEGLPATKSGTYSARGEGLGKRQLGVSERQLKAAGLDPTQAAELSNRIASDMRQASRKATSEGKDRIPDREIVRILNNHLPKPVAQELFQRIKGGRQTGGAPISTRELIGAVKRGLLTRPGQKLSFETLMDKEGKALPKSRLTEYKARAAELSKGQMTAADAAAFKAAYQGTKIEKGTILASRNPLVRRFQRVQLGLMLEHPASRIPGAGRNLQGLLHLEDREATRIRDDALKHEIVRTPEEIAKMEKEAKNRKLHLGDYVDTTNQIAQIGVLYLKPSYYPANMIGQIALAMADHSWNPINVAKSVAIQRQLYRNGQLSGPIAKRIKGAMQEGITQSVKTGHGASKVVERLHSDAAKVSNFFLDTPFRDNAFINEARRQGYRDAKSIEKLVMSKEGTPEFDRFMDVARRANKNMIDYGRLSSVEKRWIRRVIFFYPWLKAATIYSGHWMADHPLQAQVFEQQGKIEAKRAGKELGPLPSYLTGAFKVGSRNVPGRGKQPIIFNPISETILGTGAETIQTVKEIAAGHMHQGTELSQYLTPAASAAISSLVTHSDLFTGHAYPQGMSPAAIFFDQIKNTPAALRLVDQLNRADQLRTGEKSTEKVLFPYTRGEAWGRFLGPGLADTARVSGLTNAGPAGGYALNTKEARSRYFAEQKGLQSKRQREVLNNQDYLRQYTEAGKKSGLFRSAPPDLRRSFALRSEQMANRQDWADRFGMNPSTMPPILKLASDLDTIVRHHLLKAKDARDLLSAYAGLGDSAIQSFTRNLAEAYLGAQTISNYKAQLKLAGQNLTVP